MSSKLLRLLRSSGKLSKRSGKPVPKRSIWNNKNGGIELSEIEQEEARAEFAAMDTDQSGNVTLDELRAFMRRKDPSVTEEQIRRRFEYLDVHGNGGLSAEEFAQARMHALRKPPPPVDLHGWHAEAVVKKLQSTSWAELRMVITQDVIALGPAGGGGYDDVIPLHEVDRLLEQRSGGRAEGVRGWSPLRNICMIFTVNLQGAEKGYNLGRKYCISADFPLQIQEGGAGGRIEGTEKHVDQGKICSCGDFVKWLHVLVSQAKVRQCKTFSAKLARSRLHVRALFDWVPFQVMIGVVLVVNFGLEIFKTQLQDILVDDNGPTPLSSKLDIVDTAFLVIFTIELFLNIYARWMWDFILDGWCCFDAMVIIMAVLTPILSQYSDFPIVIFRLFRAMRILRLFGRLKSVRSIINALSASILPVANAFFIMFVVLMIYAILGVSLFAGTAPDKFGKFDRSVTTLFRIAGGDTWVDGMEESDWVVAGYVFSFIVIVNWTLLQVSVAVLLDNFVSETSREKEAAHKLIKEENCIQDSTGNVLDPLLNIIVVEYIDHASLASSLAEIFHFLLTSVGAQDELTCDDMINGISKIDVGDDQQGISSHATRMHMTKMDYDTITQQGALAKDNGALGAAEFDMVMRKQVHDYIKRKLQRSVSETETFQDFISFASLKALVMEVDAIKVKQMEMHLQISEMHSHICKVSSSNSEIRSSTESKSTDGLPFRREFKTSSCNGHSSFKEEDEGAISILPGFHPTFIHMSSFQDRSSTLTTHLSSREGSCSTEPCPTKARKLQIGHCVIDSVSTPANLPAPLAPFGDGQEAESLQGLQEAVPNGVEQEAVQGAFSQTKRVEPQVDLLHQHKHYITCAVQEQAAAQVLSEGSDNLQLTRLMEQFGLEDADVLASNGIKKDRDLSLIDDDVIEDLQLSSESKAKLRMLHRKLTGG
jgi:hypothetical protein